MSDDAVLAVIDALNELGIDYMLVGSFATSLYGLPGISNCADFVGDFQGDSTDRLVRELAPRFEIEPPTTFETTSGSIRRVLRVCDSQMNAAVFELSNDPHDQRSLQRRTTRAMLGKTVFVTTVDDIVITMLRWCLVFSLDKFRDDLVDLVAVQQNNIDWPYVHKWCDQHGTRQLLDEIRLTVPKV